LEAEIKLSYKNKREAEAVAQAVSPDNVKVPSGLSIKTTKEGSQVFTSVKCETKLQTFIATIDDLLCYISIAEKAFLAARKFE